MVVHSLDEYVELVKQGGGATGRLEEIVGHADGGDPTVGGNPYALDPRGCRCPHVTVAVANDHGLVGTEPQIAHGFCDHSRRRLAAIAAVVRSVRAEVDRLQSELVHRQHGLQPVMNAIKRRKVEITACDPGLVGDQNQREAGVAQQVQALDRAWRKLEFRPGR